MKKSLFATALLIGAMVGSQAYIRNWRYVARVGLGCIYLVK